MAEESIISWNFANWVTVALMVGVLYILVVTFHRIANQGGTTASSGS